MIKVKEFLDENFKHKETVSYLKTDGHYYVDGAWLYSIKQSKKIDYKDTPSKLDNCINCNCNDETLNINVIIEGKNVNQYNQFTTSLKIERGEADKFGYYKRSTDEEIINYIKHYLNILNSLK